MVGSSYLKLVRDTSGDFMIVETFFKESWDHPLSKLL